MDENFTKKLQDWLNTPDTEKDYAAGALLLLQLSGNAIMYHNLAVYPQGHAEFITAKLQEYLNFRLKDVTHKEVVAMQKQVDEIVKSHTEFKNPETNPATEFKAGKRADHDTLPDDIKALYVENLAIVHRMRELHLKLRTLSTTDSPCPDSDRYPFLKELIALDKKLHDNWNTYDHFVAQPQSVVATSPTATPETADEVAASPVPSEAAPSTDSEKSETAADSEADTAAAQTEAKPKAKAKSKKKAKTSE